MVIHLLSFYYFLNSRNRDYNLVLRIEVEVKHILIWYSILFFAVYISENGSEANTMVNVEVNILFHIDRILQIN